MRFTSKIQIVFEVGFDDINEQLAKQKIVLLSEKIRKSFEKEYGTNKVKVTSRIKKLPF